ncbi:MAG: phosphoribosylformylglycinamidine synthase subunit PurL [Bacteroidales bacterium]|nr:phosphoribosylformylglycinamidine synthase subunit PurL [Bacteroidales bacterium]
MEITVKTAEKLGLLAEEYDKIVEVLGRTPNFTELSLFSVMWSEHASYKNSIKWLKTLHREGKHMLAEPGAENAGVVDLGDDIACVFKIESHNHPSAIEPYQGAATGVGGINRDIFSMGARPIAQLNSLRFGDLHLDKTKWLIKGVVKGIGDYGNAFGVPVVGGEVYFDSSYNTNPLVNAMSVGIVKKDRIISATSYGVGNPVYIFGSATGKDGIHGATFASADLTKDSHEDLPSVQVGDPFAEKLILEASLELAETDVIIGMQDMGAAGIICSTSEMSAKGEHGMKIYLDKVPLRQQNIQPWEILLSESQERMLVVLKKGQEKVAEDIFNKWDIQFAQIGEVTEGDQLEFYWNEELVANVPADILVLGGGAPVYEREFQRPTYFFKNQEFNIDEIPVPEDFNEVACKLIQSPNIVSRRWIFEQYDSMVRTSTISTNFVADAGIINLKGTDKALAVTTDCNSRYVYANPNKGTQIAVAEAARNIVCSGGEPVAVTNCLNFGNPYNPEVYWQFVEAIKGMNEACKKFSTPVTGGNVSFYNQTVLDDKTEPIFPTPVIGMLGIIPNKNDIMTIGFKDKGDVIFVLGETKNDISSSEYLNFYHAVKYSNVPYFDLDTEFRLQEITKKLIKLKLIRSAHDVSEGGLFITLVESSMIHNVGFDITTDSDVRTDAFLFGESQSRIVVSVTPNKINSFIDFMRKQDFPFLSLGHVTKGELRIDDISFGFVYDIKKKYMDTLGNLIEGK